MEPLDLGAGQPASGGIVGIGQHQHVKAVERGFDVAHDFRHGLIVKEMPVCVEFTGDDAGAGQG